MAENPQVSSFVPVSFAGRVQVVDKVVVGWRATLQGHLLAIVWLSPSRVSPPMDSSKTVAV